MSTLDLTPVPGAAPVTRRILSHALTEFRLNLRNYEQLLLNLVIPLGVLITGRFVGSRLDMGMDDLAPGVLALALWSTGFTSLAIATGYERRYGVLERLAATPLRTSGLLAGKALATLLLAAGQWVLLGGVAVALGWRPRPTGAQLAVLAYAAPMALAAFAGLGLILAGALRAEVTLGLANLVYLVGVVGGGLIVPLAAYPASVQLFVAATPTWALNAALKPWHDPLAPLVICVVVTVWAALSLLLARTVFRWTS